MSHNNTLYNQILHLMPRHHFEGFVKRYKGNHYVKYYTCWQQFMTLFYAQMKAKDSLRDIETSLKSQSSRWYHIGLKDIKRSTLSDANNQRDYRIYEDFFYTLLERYKSITPKHKFRFQNPLYIYSRCYSCRFMSQSFSLGKIQKEKRGIKTSLYLRPQWFNSIISYSSRCQAA